VGTPGGGPEGAPGGGPAALATPVTMASLNGMDERPGAKFGMDVVSTGQLPRPPPLGGIGHIPLLQGMQLSPAGGAPAGQVVTHAVAVTTPESQGATAVTVTYMSTVVSITLLESKSGIVGWTHRRGRNVRLYGRWCSDGHHLGQRHRHNDLVLPHISSVLPPAVAVVLALTLTIVLTLTTTIAAALPLAIALILVASLYLVV
jgi:hypothetical protein